MLRETHMKLKTTKKLKYINRNNNGHFKYKAGILINTNKLIDLFTDFKTFNQRTRWQKKESDNSHT